MNDQNQNDTDLGETGTDSFDAGVAKVAREIYHTPPETPRDDMWAVIQAARAADVVPIRRFRPQPWWAAVAAALVIGVVLGRGTLGGPDAVTTVADGGADVPAAVDGATPEGTPDGSANLVPRSYRFAAARHLNRSETFLTMFRVDARSDQLNDEDIGTWSKRLLTDTRLLLDSPAGGDPELRRLLSDLELVLAQIVQLRTGDPNEVEIIDEGLESSQLLFRLKAAQASAPATVRL
ncbi:MAG: hypothetical protein KAI98_06405 [Gemmatimonadetes bacterium]|nr:hypothetical protein [Gemmatimonadota bacterium]